MSEEDVMKTLHDLSTPRAETRPADDVSPWFLVGILETLVREHGSVTVAGWNRAVEQAQAFKRVTW